MLVIRELNDMAFYLTCLRVCVTLLHSQLSAASRGIQPGSHGCPGNVNVGLRNFSDLSYKCHQLVS